MQNLFTIISSDGKLNNEPNGVFTETSTYPTDQATIIKGSSDILCINDGLPGFVWGGAKTNKSFFIKENGQPAPREGSTTPGWLGNGPIKLQGSTVYGYIITNETHNHPVAGQNTPSYTVNFITNPSYKLDQPTYNGWGRTDISLTVTNQDWLGYYIDQGGYVSPDLTGRIYYAPITYEFVNSSNAYVNLAFMTVIDGKIGVSEMIISKTKEPVQGIENTNYVSTYGPTSITILNSDIIIPSLEDRVDKLEKQVAEFPSDIATAFALAVDKVSKIFVSR